MGKTRKLNQLDYETGELIETYNNMEEAASDNFISVKALRKALSKRDGYMIVAKLRFEFI